MKGEQAGKKKVKTCTQKDTSQYSMRTAMETRIGSCQKWLYIYKFNHVQK